MSQSYNAFDHKGWGAAGLKDYCDFSDAIEYVNQSEYGDGQLEGAWYYCDDETRTIYCGSFGNYNSPGASSYTYAEVYDEEEREEYEADKRKWESKPEYLDNGEDEEDSEEDEEDEEDEEESDVA